MMHHEVTFKKASVMSMALLSIFCISLQAMDELAYLRDYSDDVETADDDTLISSIRTSAQKVKEVPVSGEAQLALKNRGLPEMQEHANTSVVPKPMEEIVIVPPAQPVPATKQNSGWNWVSFTPLLENQAVLYGVGVVGILTISAVTYVLYKNGVFTKIANEAENHPWSTAAITGAAALVMAAGILYYQGATKESVTAFLTSVFTTAKTHVQNAPDAFVNFTKKLARIA